jgi:hypothetical protein
MWPAGLVSSSRDGLATATVVLAELVVAMRDRPDEPWRFARQSTPLPPSTFLEMRVEITTLYRALLRAGLTANPHVRREQQKPRGAPLASRVQ